MKELEYFSIGWNSATVSTELGILENDFLHKPKDWVLENSLEMLTHCETVFDISKMIKDWDIRYNYHKLICEFVNPLDKYEPVRTLAKIRKIKSTMQDIQEGKRVSKTSLEKAHKFFGDLSDKCLYLMQSLYKTDSEILRFAA